MWRPIREKFLRNLERQGTLIHPQQKHFSHWSFLASAGTGMILVGINLVLFNTNTTVSATTEIILNIVAHEDDDLLFFNPDLLHAIQSGRKVRTIFLTAGDSGADTDYWEGRESGIKAAYAQMAGVANTWTQTDAGIAGHPIPVFTLSAYPSVSLAFMRLPDGNFDGSGFPSTHYETLRKLWTDTISTIHTIGGSSSYSKATLINTLTSLISSFQPNQINTQDYIGSYGDGDHSDHHSVAYLVQAAVQQYTTPHSFKGYENYNTFFFPANIRGADLAAKQKAFYTYAQNDNLVCNSTSSCANTDYAVWLQRQYTVGPGWQQGRWRKHMPARQIWRLISRLYRSYRQILTKVTIS